MLISMLLPSSFYIISTVLPRHYWAVMKSATKRNYKGKTGQEIKNQQSDH